MNKIIFFSLAILLPFYSQTQKPKLTDFGYNKYSQDREDGIIEKIFEIIGATSKICIEFGAADGLFYANTAQLWKYKDWEAILIESEAAYFPKLRENTKGYTCTLVHRAVGNEKDNKLECILEKHNLSTQIDLLSIDIDGNDYYIFESLNILRPRVIICEYNPTIPAHLDMYAPYNNSFGASVAALNRIAESKGYKLIALTICNAFFVIKEEFAKFSNFETQLAVLASNKHVKYLVTNYAGRYMIVGQQGSMPYGLTKPYNKEMFGTYNEIEQKYRTNLYS